MEHCLKFILINVMKMNSGFHDAYMLQPSPCLEVELDTSPPSLRLGKSGYLSQQKTSVLRTETLVDLSKG